MYLKHLEQHLVHSRCSVSICWMNEWMWWYKLRKEIRGKSKFGDEGNELIVMCWFWAACRTFEVNVSHRKRQFGPDTQEKKLAWDRILEMLAYKRWLKSWTGSDKPGEIYRTRREKGEKWKHGWRLTLERGRRDTGKRAKGWRKKVQKKVGESKGHCVLASGK